MSPAERVAPAELVDEIERRGIRRRVMVDDIVAGEPVHEEGCRGEDLMRAREDLRRIALQPQDLRADGLRGQRIAAAVEKHVLADREVSSSISSAARVSTP